MLFASHLIALYFIYINLHYILIPFICAAAAIIDDAGRTNPTAMEAAATGAIPVPRQPGLRPRPSAQTPHPGSPRTRPAENAASLRRDIKAPLDRLPFRAKKSGAPSLAHRGKKSRDCPDQIWMLNVTLKVMPG